MSVIATITVLAMLALTWLMTSPWVRLKAFEHQMRQYQKRRAAYYAGLREFEASVSENGVWTV